MYQFVNDQYPHKEKSALTLEIASRDDMIVKQCMYGGLALYEKVNGKLYMRLWWTDYDRGGYSRSSAAELMLRNYPLEKSAYTFMKG